MFCRLWDPLHVNAVVGEVLNRVATVGVSQAPGMANFAVSDVVEGHRFGMAGIEPVGGLVNNAGVTLGRVGVGDQKLELRVGLQSPEYHRQYLGLAVSR